jgi:hypothetical protein
MPFSNHSRRQDRLHWLAEMYRASAADLQHFLSNKVGDPTVAEDLTSTVFRKRTALAEARIRATIACMVGSMRRLVPPLSIDFQAQSQYEMRSLSGLQEQLLKSDDAAEASKPAEMRVQHASRPLART